MKIEIRPEKAFRVLLTVIFCLTVGDIVALWLKFGLDHDYVFGLVPLFDFNEEMNIPTFFSSVILLTAAMLLACIAEAHRRQSGRFAAWYGLAAIFLFLAIDENAGIHELFQAPASRLVDASGLFFHAWIIPYVAVLAILLPIYGRFMAALPHRTMVLFGIAGAIFVAGAVGFEAIGGSYLEQHGPNVGYHILTTIEEGMEMFGISLFVYALLAYMETELPTLSVAVGGSKISLRPVAPVEPLLPAAHLKN